MSDSYQAIFDAVRSRISNGDIGQAVEAAFRELELSGWSQRIVGSVYAIEAQQTRPSVLYRPRLTADGNMWCALYGDDLQSGVAGFGASPELAMMDFDAAFSKNISVKGEK